MRQPPAAFHLAAALSPHVTFNVTYYVAALVEVALCTWKLVTVISDMCRAAPFPCLARLGVVTPASPRTLHYTFTTAIFKIIY
ncbi:hypothetical protein J6590_025629 [Homalodisca vitripennis]|nr:hypothetical protein J6590_025625 [Homalodisca vitripennis]KAG8273197.1 hypothetical protein J6590_025629 [Homalodisca vitripennis]